MLQLLLKSLHNSLKNVFQAIFDIMSEDSEDIQDNMASNIRTKRSRSRKLRQKVLESANTWKSRVAVDTTSKFVQRGIHICS